MEGEVWSLSGGLLRSGRGEVLVVCSAILSLQSPVQHFWQL